MSYLRHLLHKGKEKGKEEYLYSAIFTIQYAKRSGMDDTVLPANYTMPAFPSLHLRPVRGTVADIQSQLTTHLSTPKGWNAELAWLADL